MAKEEVIEVKDKLRACPAPCSGRLKMAKKAHVSGKMRMHFVDLQEIVFAQL